MHRKLLQAAAMAGILALTRTSAGGEGGAYDIDPRESRVTIMVGKAGLFSFAGHTHEVLATALRGDVHVVPDDPTRSRVAVTFDANALKVTGKGEPADDVPKVQANMIGPKVLDAARYPEITFVSRRVRGRVAGPGAWDLDVEGDLHLHGVTRPMTLVLRADARDEVLSATGKATLRQTHFGIQPLSVAGVVNVKDEVEVTYRIVARRR